MYEAPCPNFKKIERCVQNRCSFACLWDEKLMQDLTRKTLVDGLPVIVSGLGIKQLLKIAKISVGSGQSQENAVVLALEEWRLAEKVVGMPLVTTTTNTGRKNGACILVEAKLEKYLLYFACRHRILELVIAAVFLTQRPNIFLFKRFQCQWESVDKTKFQTGDENERCRDCKSEILKRAKLTLEQKDLRDDYCEILEMSIIFLGNIPFQESIFRPLDQCTELDKWQKSFIP